VNGKKLWVAPNKFGDPELWNREVLRGKNGCLQKNGCGIPNRFGDPEAGV
jgi:hypothetical protein